MYTCTILEGQKLEHTVQNADSHRQPQEVGVGLQQCLLQVVSERRWRESTVAPKQAELVGNQFTVAMPTNQLTSHDTS